jgi:hypothetical protein
MYFQKKWKSGADVVGETESQKRTREADVCEVVKEKHGRRDRKQ